MGINFLMISCDISSFSIWIDVVKKATEKCISMIADIFIEVTPYVNMSKHDMTNS